MRQKLLCILLPLLLAVTQSAAADNLGYSKINPLIFGIDIDYAPMEWVDDDGMPHGLDVALTQELMRRLSIPFTYSPNTWLDIKDDVLSGHVDLGMMVYSPYRKDITNFSRAVFHLYYQILFRKSDQNKLDIRNLSGRSIAYMASKPLTDTLNHAGAIPNVITDLPKAIKDLSAGRYDGVICFRYQARYHMKHLGLNNLLSEDLSLPPREYCYVSHSKQLIDAINVELNMMEAEGVIDKIYGSTLSSGGINIPDWVWYLIGGLFVLLLVIFAFIQWKHQKKLKREMERAQRSEALKTVFLSNVSHALRTPLNSIIGFSQIAIDDKDDTLSRTERLQMAEHINKNGHQLLYFINELLELSNFEGKEMLFERTEINLPEVMEEFAAETRRIVNPSVKVVVNACEGHVEIDKNLMRLVTMHALNNAAHNTKKGTITLSCYPQGKGLRIDVKDTGSGLPEDLKDNIFAMLSEKNAYVRDDMPGLGLTICKAVVDRVGGRIGADSPPEGGTLLWHWIPRVVKK